MTTVSNTFIVDGTIAIKAECFKLAGSASCFFKWIFFGDSNCPSQFTILYIPVYATGERSQRRENADGWQGRERQTMGSFGQLRKDVVVDSQDQLVAWELNLHTKQQKSAACVCEWSAVLKVTLSAQQSTV